jgi:hypothetical protein
VEEPEMLMLYSEFPALNNKLLPEYGVRKSGCMTATRADLPSAAMTGAANMAAPALNSHNREPVRESMA